MAGYDPLNNQEDEGTGATIGAGQFLSALGLGGVANTLGNVQNKIADTTNHISESITGMPAMRQPNRSITSGQPQQNQWQGFGKTFQNFKNLMTPRGW